MSYWDHTRSITTIRPAQIPEMVVQLRGLVDAGHFVK